MNQTMVRNNIMNDMLKKYQNKHPYLTKVLLKYDDIETVYEKQLDHFFDIYQSHQKEIKKYHINYSQFNDFKELYSLFLDISKEEPVNIPVDYFKFEICNDWYVIPCHTFEDTRRYGSNFWCISNSQKWWNKYNKNSKHYILVNKQNHSSKIGISFNNESLYIFDEYDRAIKPTKLKKIIPSISSKLNINIDIYIKKRNLFKEYKDLMILSVNLTLFSFLPNFTESILFNFIFLLIGIKSFSSILHFIFSDTYTKRHLTLIILMIFAYIPSMNLPDINLIWSHLSNLNLFNPIIWLHFLDSISLLLTSLTALVIIDRITTSIIYFSTILPSMMLNNLVR